MLLPVPFHIYRACPNKICCQKCRKMLFLFPKKIFCFCFCFSHNIKIELIGFLFEKLSSALSESWLRLFRFKTICLVVAQWSEIRRKVKRNILANGVRTFSSQSQNLMFGSCLPLLIQDNLSSRGTVVRNWKKSKKIFWPMVLEHSAHNHKI